MLVYLFDLSVYLLEKPFNSEVIAITIKPNTGIVHLYWRRGCTSESRNELHASRIWFVRLIRYGCNEPFLAFHRVEKLIEWKGNSLKTTLIADQINFFNPEWSLFIIFFMIFSDLCLTMFQRGQCPGKGRDCFQIK